MITLHECKLQLDTVQAAAQKAKHLPLASATAWSPGLSSHRFIFPISIALAFGKENMLDPSKLVAQQFGPFSAS